MAGMQGNCCVVRGGKVSIGDYKRPVIVNGAPQWPIQFRDMGEVAEATITVEPDKKERMTHRSPAGGLACSFTRIKSAKLKMKVDCSNADNQAMAVLGLTTNITGGVVLAEDRIVIKPECGLTPLKLDYLVDLSKPIVLTSLDGTITYAQGTDYIIENGHIMLPATSTIPDSAAPGFAPTLRASYTKRMQQQIQGAMTAGKAFALEFAGFEVGSGQVDGYLAGVRYAQITPSAMKFIGDDFDQIEMEFDLLPDPSLGGYPDLSPYFYGFFGANPCV